ncbi:MAG TPA: PASTA domain-containing protein [Acidobacteriota bacterium]|jgi:serine/threonine-protein kinase
MGDLFFRTGKLFLLTMIVVAVGFISFFTAMKLAISGQEVIIPTVLGQDLKRATQILDDVNLKIKVRGERYEPRVQRGRISTQLPAAGTRIKKDNAVNVIVSLGKMANPTPDVEGATLRAAQLLLVQQGYQLGNLSEIHLGQGEPDRIVTQFPTPQTRELVGNKVDVLVNKGLLSQVYVMPDVLGWDLNRALAFLEQNKVRLPEISYAVYQDVPLSTVVKQYPEPGFPFRLTDPVRLEVSK